ncbi:MAG TPA: hypothetical protein VKM55_14040 [Candidatus Lokiarchaeia archaeon]|nr:hypothetical protein [Candidatus Lokiarchaeia archaeon]
MTKNNSDSTRKPSRNERIAFYSAWMVTGFLSGLDSAIIHGFAGAGVGFLMAWASELETRCLGGFFWHDLPKRIILLWIVAGFFVIAGALFSDSAGILIGLKVGAIHGGIIAFIPLKKVRWTWTFPAVGFGIGLLAGGGIGGYIGLLAALLPLICIELLLLLEYTDPQWHGPGWLLIVIVFLMIGALVALDVLGAIFGLPVEGAGAALGVFLVYIFILFYSVIHYEARGEKLMGLQRQFDEAFPSPDEVDEQPTKLNEAIASIATVLEYYAKDPKLHDTYLEKNLGQNWVLIKPLWQMYKAREISLQELLIRVANEQGVDAFKALVGNVSPRNHSTWHYHAQPE